MNTRPPYSSPVASVGITDGENIFVYLMQYDEESGSLFVYCPDYSPESLNGDSLKYKLAISDMSEYAEKEVCSQVFDRSECLACSNPFRFEDNTYYDCLEISDLELDVDRPIYVSLTPVIDESDSDDEEHWIPNKDYTGGQGTIPILNKFELVINHSKDRFIIYPLFGNEKITEDMFIEYIENCFGLDSESFRYSIQLTLADRSDAYLTLSTDTSSSILYDDEHIGTYFLTSDFLSSGSLESNSDWNGNMVLVATLTIYRLANEEEYDDETDESSWRAAITYHSSPIPVTPELLATILGNGEIIDIPDNMIIQQPRMVNRTIQNVINMTSQTDSKANIIQPVFFRSRELASLLIHPEVNENICINLDAYKAQVDSFILKVEGICFNESGRTNSGVIFLVEGNLLPGSADEGIVYILNQDDELVTTGKYTYEY